MKRKEEFPHTNRERRRFANVSDVRHELARLYWDMRTGGAEKVHPKLAPSMVRALELIAKLMMESEQEQAVREMREELDALLAEIEQLGATRLLPADLLARVRPANDKPS